MQSNLHSFSKGKNLQRLVWFGLLGVRSLLFGQGPFVLHWDHYALTLSHHNFLMSCSAGGREKRSSTPYPHFH